MSGWHRHNPEFSDVVDLMFGVELKRPNEAVVDAPDEDFDMEQFEDDIALLSRMALEPAPDTSASKPKQKCPLCRYEPTPGGLATRLSALRQLGLVRSSRFPPRMTIWEITPEGETAFAEAVASTAKDDR